jgi:hypothetical protein
MGGLQENGPTPGVLHHFKDDKNIQLPELS